MATRWPVPSAAAVRRDGPIVLDGKLDEAAWQRPHADHGFPADRSRRGQAGVAAHRSALPLSTTTRCTSARRCTTRRARKGVITRLVRRDAIFDSDYFEIVIDGYHDHLSRAFFDVNPSGSKGDYIGIGTSCCDTSWDPVWEAATRIDDGRLDGGDPHSVQPASLLARLGADVGTAGAPVHQAARRAGSVVVVGQDRGGRAVALRPSRGTAHSVRRRSHLELLPYVVSKSSSVATTPGDPFNTQRSADDARRARSQGSADVEPHARRDDQSGLRPGRSRSGGAQPLGVRDVLSGEAAVLRRRRRRCSTSAASAATSAATSKA